MNILQLCAFERESNLSLALRKLDHKVYDKHKVKDVSIVSYDAYIISISFFAEMYNQHKKFFEEIEKQNKSIIFIYDYDDDLNLLSSIDYFKEKYNIKFKVSDCSIIEKNNLEYNPCVAGEDEAITMNSKKCDCYCNVKGINQYFILKLGNHVILHDFEVSTFGNGELINRYAMQLLIEFLFNNETHSIKANWLDRIVILNDDILLNSLDSLNNDIIELESKKSNVIEELSKNNIYKSILYESGNKLVEIVKQILEEMLNITIDDTDYKKHDLFFVLNKKHVLVEVKGVNRPFKRENISQIKRHVIDYAEKNSIFGADVDSMCKGVLIINPYSLHELDDKISKDFYSAEVIEDAKYNNICTLDTLTLLNFYSKWKQNPKSVDIQNIILNNTYNEPDYQSIIK